MTADVPASANARGVPVQVPGTAPLSAGAGTTALAVARPKSLVRDLAADAGVDPDRFYAAVKVAAGCRGATNEHFMVLLMQAQKYGLDPLSNPPQVQLLDVGNGPQVYYRIDAFKVFLHRAEADGRVEWRKYEDGWFPDPNFPPDQKRTKRGGRVTMKLRGRQEPVVKVVWLDEWRGSDKSQWPKRTAHMLEARAWKEACREWLGFVGYDTDDAERIRDEPRRVEAEVRDTTPAVPVAFVEAPPEIPDEPPPPIEPASPADRLPDPESEEGRRLAAELNAAAAAEGEA